MKRLVAMLILLTVAIYHISYGQNAIFAGGCFWCMQEAFDKTPGVTATTVGYDGGIQPNPSYSQVSAGQTAYAETVQVTYNPEKISYTQLLQTFWHNIDPTVRNRQFCDTGRQYRSAIFYLNGVQKTAAIQSLQALRRRFSIVYTEILPSTHFYPAESYHQNYYRKNPVRYHFYKWNCGRAQRLKQLWGDH
ncbi:MAG: peptide-methionine (S)-S-oxide reductase MsrA [Gammaproteobacteria bacterium]|nr:peptide-methionine (S)-S-oxide reductase MsrA [Gammaproteobacteria bacterium]